MILNHKIEKEERLIYQLIASNDGIKAREIAKQSGLDKTRVNQYLYKAAFMRELCYRDENFFWHGMIRQTRPHKGLGDFSGYYGTVGEFLELSEDEWFQSLMEGCKNIGRNLNDTRGLFHSFKDSYGVMKALFAELPESLGYDEWEILFELRINRAKYIRIYADVLLVTKDKVFSLEFKMKDVIDQEEVVQAAKYIPYQEVIFGDEYDVIPVLVLTKAEDLYTYAALQETTAEVAVVSGDMLFNVLDEYIGFLED